MIDLKRWLASVILVIDWDAHQKRYFGNWLILVRVQINSFPVLCQCIVQAEKGREGELKPDVHLMSAFLAWHNVYNMYIV